LSLFIGLSTGGGIQISSDDDDEKYSNQANPVQSKNM